MRQAINISEEDIAYAERILLPNGMVFDSERRKFIRNLDNIDLQAVPGSGKTTALLAKLLILDRKLPFKDGSGILVLSHTNSAIDEIKRKIYKHCKKLFSYPSFVGTIQSFTDEFLAIPCGHNILKTRISRIDKDDYEEKLWAKFEYIAWDKTYDKPGKLFYQRFKDRAKQESELRGEAESTIYKELIQKMVKSLYFDHLQNKIKSYSDNSFSLKTATNKKFIGLKKIIEEVLSNGVISYDYAYHLGEVFLEKVPAVKIILQKRFHYVFVDEMQDMDTHQYDLLESIFYDKGSSISIYQRVGDKNQAIYNSVKLDDIWQDRNLVLPLTGSHRLSKSIADTVSSFALHRGDSFKITGFRDGEIKPHILLFKNETVQDVIPFFAKITNEFKSKGMLHSFGEYPVKVIAWNTEWKTQDEIDDITKIRLTDYHSKFEKNRKNIKQVYAYLKSYLIYYDRKKKTLGAIRKNILNALLKVLSLEDVIDDRQRNYTKSKLLKYLLEQDLLGSTKLYEVLNLHLYNWSIDIIRGRTDNVWGAIKNYIPELLKVFGKTINYSDHFINDDAEGAEIMEGASQVRDANRVKIEGLDIEVATVHSVKGHTHCATLYLESYYHKDGKNDNAKSYESQRLANQFLGNPVATNAKKREKESLKMVYVGFSRSTDLLCIAVHIDRFNKYLSYIDKNMWEIQEVVKR